MGNRSGQHGVRACRVCCPRLIPRQGLGRHLQGRLSQKTSRSLSLRQQRLHFPAQRIIPGAGFIEKLRALTRITLDGVVVQAFDFEPALTLHSASPCSTPAAANSWQTSNPA